MSRIGPQGSMYKKQHGVTVRQVSGHRLHANTPRAVQHLGAPLPQQPTTPAPRKPDDLGDFIEVPAFYTISVTLGGVANDQVAGSVPLRPERFLCRRITYAFQADSPPYVLAAFGSPNANCVEIIWGDEFTQFLGANPALMGALFGQANGFLDLPQGILFQGRQSLNASLRRLQWPGIVEQAVSLRSFRAEPYNAHICPFRL